MKKLFVISLIFFFSCKSKKEEINLLSKKEIVEIKLHLTLMEEKLQIMKIDKDSAEHFFDYYRNQLFLEKGVDRKNFDDSYNYYLINDLDGYVEIQNAMIDSLTKYKNTLTDYE